VLQQTEQKFLRVIDHSDDSIAPLTEQSPNIPGPVVAIQDQPLALAIPADNLVERVRLPLICTHRRVGRRSGLRGAKW
jgi:hypothetical protein